MNRVFAEPGTELTQFEFFAAGFAPHGVIVLAAFFADQKHGFRLLFTFFSGHDLPRINYDECSLCLKQTQERGIIEHPRPFGSPPMRLAFGVLALGRCRRRVCARFVGNLCLQRSPPLPPSDRPLWGALNVYCKRGRIGRFLVPYPSPKGRGDEGLDPTQKRTISPRSWYISLVTPGPRISK